MDHNEIERSHYELLLEKLKTGDYFEYAATLAGYENINFQVYHIFQDVCFLKFIMFYITINDVFIYFFGVSF